MYAELTRKVCNLCKEEKPVSAFASKRGKPNSRCKRCIGEYMKSHYLANRDREIAKRRDWYSKNREAAIKAVRKNYEENKDLINLRRKLLRYGLTEEQYKQMHLSQNGKCASCLDACSDLVIDHCHTTNKVRGLLCGNCNTSLGLQKENPTRIQNLLEYVLKHQK